LTALLAQIGGHEEDEEEWSRFGACPHPTKITPSRTSITRAPSALDSGVRTIECWDIERRRYPQYEHVAVIVAEDIAARFLNVFSLFNGFIPLVAIQVNAVEIDDRGGPPRPPSPPIRRCNCHSPPSRISPAASPAAT
jgi:hypothetical protein